MGFNYGLDLYEHFTNPERAGDTTLHTAGNAIANIIIGPKLFLGYNKFSISGEVQINWGITAFCYKEFKGIGALSFPFLCKMNFGGLSGLTDNTGKFGFSLGGGLQYSMTEIYGLETEFQGLTTRDLFKTYVGEMQIGYRAESGIASLYFRYGQGANNSSVFNIGYISSFIFPSRHSGKHKH